MMIRDQVLTFRTLILPVVACVVLAFSGCNKSNDDVPAGSAEKDAAAVILRSNSMNPDGTLNEQGLQAIQAKADNPNLTVIFFRSTLSDAGLSQLAKFPKLHRVETTGSRVTDKGVEKLKQAIPQVEVVK